MIKRQGEVYPLFLILNSDNRLFRNKVLFFGVLRQHHITDRYLASVLRTFAQILAYRLGLQIPAIRYIVCLAWPFARWCKSTFLNCLFRGVVEDDPEGLAPYWGWQAHNREVMGDRSCRQNRRPKRKWTHWWHCINWRPARITGKSVASCRLKQANEVWWVCSVFRVGMWWKWMVLPREVLCSPV